MADSISDFLTVIRNACKAKKDSCMGKYSRLHWSIAKILKDEGYIRDAAESKDTRGHRSIKLTMKYVDELPAITGLQRWSKSGRRLYYRYDDIPRVLDGLGVGILTTSKGVMNDREARRTRVGGEMICAVW